MLAMVLATAAERAKQVHRGRLPQPVIDELRTFLPVLLPGCLRWAHLSTHVMHAWHTQC
jgi:hypothetical protein